MNARDLMIGDLVRVTEPDRYHGAICRIVSLINHKDDECAYFKVFILTKGNLLHEVCNEDIEPIPLTHAILEKNANGGWCFFDFNGRSVYHINDDKEEVSIYVEWRHTRNEPYVELDGLGWTVFKGYCASVSKIQHALRLCGLNDFADNFKI